MTATREARASTRKETRGCDIAGGAGIRVSPIGIIASASIIAPPISRRGSSACDNPSRVWPTTMASSEIIA